ncbi:MAG: ABC transporter permease [Acidobacteria bacterium]|nr:ABC transporter permease [Acidobacteriota bacterium]
MDTLLQDLKYAIRSLRRSPGFTLAAVAALTMGIGATTAIFSIVNTVLLTPAPFPEPDRIVLFQLASPQGTNPAGSPAKFAHWARQTDVVQDVAAFRNGLVNYTGGDLPEQLRWAQVSVDYFRLFGTPIVQGRVFAPEEDLPNGQQVALISEQLWERRFDRDPSVVGRTVSLSGEPYVVVGVVGDSFNFRDFGPAPDVWTPFQLDPNTDSQGHFFRVAGRLKPGVALAQAQTALEHSTEAYRQRFPDVLGEDGLFGVVPVRDMLVRNVRSLLWVLMGAVGIVLLIACSNVANLLLVRATGRKQEIAIRTAIGAGRGRIIRQLLTESVLPSVAGGALGLALGVTGIRALLSVNTAGLPRIGTDGALVGVDWRVLVFAFVVSFGTGVLFGLIPALQGSRADLSGTLKESGGRTGTGFRQNKTRAVLVVSEVALALILLVGSALLIRSSLALNAVDPGFDATNVLTMRMSLTGPRFATAAGVEQLLREGLDRVRALPGVEHAAATCCVPLQGGFGLPFVIAGRPLDDGPFHGGGGWTTVSDGFFEVFRIPTRRGRVFTERDGSGAPPVVVINETMASQFWPDGDPLADRITIGRGLMPAFADEPERQIIGVVADIRDGGLNTDPSPRMYVPQAQLADAANAMNLELAPMGWIVRTQTSPQALSSAIQEELQLASGLPVSDVRTMDEVVSRSTSRQRFNMLLMTVFGAAALLLAAIGIYGLMAYSVEQRTQEIGIRLALGAETGQIWTMVVLQGMRLVMAGVVIGLASASGLTRFIASFLFEVEAWDPAAFITVPVVLTAVAMVAVMVPAHRASRVDPMAALRNE